MKAWRTATPARHSLPDARPEKTNGEDTKNENRSGYVPEKKG
jgi:hypothetical protein